MPQLSPSFAPFDLLYSRHVQGPHWRSFGQERPLTFTLSSSNSTLAGWHKKMSEKQRNQRIRYKNLKSQSLPEDANKSASSHSSLGRQVKGRREGIQQKLSNSEKPGHTVWLEQPPNRLGSTVAYTLCHATRFTYLHYKDSLRVELVSHL